MPSLLAALHWPLLFSLQPFPIVLLTVMVVLAGLLWWRPSVPARGLLWLFVRVFYRMRVLGADNIPKSGPALLVCNHVSYIDFLLLLAAQWRYIRFVFFAGWSRVLFIRHLLRWGRAIPIDASSGPKAILKSLRAAGEALDENDLVCIFAEGRFTRTGFLLPFHRGLEQIVKRNAAPIIPVCLDELWGSIFSFYGDRTLWKWPRAIPYPITVAFGKPMPATSSAAEVRAAVQKLAADCALARSEECRPIHREFVRTAARHPMRPCVIDVPGANLSVKSSASSYRYCTVLARAIHLARSLRPQLRETQLIGIWLAPGIHAVCAHLAAAFCGKAIVHLDRHSSSESIQAAIAECRITKVLTTGRFMNSYPLPSLDGVEPIDVEQIFTADSAAHRFLRQLAAVILPGWLIDRWILRLNRHRPDELAAVVFTRGTSARPKPVMLTHRNLVSSIAALVKTVDPRPSDRVLGVLPLSQCTGYVCTLWAPLAVGSSIVYAPDFATFPTAASRTEQGFQQLGELCRTRCCTIMLANPDLLTQCGAFCQPDDFRSLHTLVCSGAKLPAELASNFERRFGVKILEAYDCTELSSIIATNVRDKTLEGFTQVGYKPGTVGQPLPGVSCQIAEPVTLKPLPAGQEGVLLVSGPNISPGYFRRNDLTGAARRDEWFITDDFAVMDEEGFLTIRGR